MNAISQTRRNKIQLYRICMPDHECPLGLQAVKFLRDRNLSFEDIKLQSQAEVAEFKTKYQVETTPQIVFGSEKMVEYTDFAVKLQAIESCKHPGLAIF